MNSLHYTCSKKISDQLRLRDVSFSSYLKQAGEDESEINVFDAKKYFSESTEWKELGNRPLFPGILHGSNQNGSCDLSEINRFSSVSSVDAGVGRNVKASSFHATPTASSEASWNSQTGLLSNPPGAIAVSLKNNNVSEGDLEKRRGSAPAKWFFCRSKCPCSGKKSVQVEEAIRNGNAHNDQQKIVLEERNQNLGLKVQVSPPETGHGVGIGLRQGESQSPLASTGGFSFPILNPSSQAVAKMTIRTTSDIEDQIPPPKNSLEIFQPPISRKSLDAVIQLSPQPRGGGVVDNRDRRAGNFGFPGSPISRDDDVGSDASSDLFEIESFSTQTTSYRRRDSLDDEGTFVNVNVRRLAASNPYYGGRRSLDEPATPSVAATENYAPSEVSIDWSVTTAEGVAMEDHAHAGGGSRHWSSEYGGEGKYSKGSGLLSCRHEKAVSVGPQPQPVKVAVAPDLIGPQTEEAPTLPVALISTTSHVTVSGRPPKPNKPPLATSHSARLSLAFAA